MSVSSVSKTTFHQMLPAFAIKLGSLGIGLSTRSIQEGNLMTFKAAARFRAGAELSQTATPDKPTSLGHVFPAQAHRDAAALASSLDQWRLKWDVTLDRWENCDSGARLLIPSPPSAAGTNGIGHMRAELAVSDLET